MSRFDSDYEAEYNNAPDLWEHNIDQAMRGKRGKRLLAEFREALLALPAKRLIEGALCAHEGGYVAEKQGAGVCAVGAFAWHRLVKAGFSGDQALEMMPEGGDDWTTVSFGKKAGLTGVLAWHFGWLNDEDLAGLTPEQRYDRVLSDIEASLLLPPLPSPRRKPAGILPEPPPLPSLPLFPGLPGEQKP